MKVRVGLVLLAFLSLYGCGGGGGGGGGSFLTRSAGLKGVWRAVLGRASGDTFDMDIAVDSGGTISGFARITTTTGDISTGAVSGSGPTGSATSGTVSLDFTLVDGPYASRRFTFDGTLDSFRMTGTYTLGTGGSPESGALNMDKITDTTVNITGRWTGSRTSALESGNLSLEVTFDQTGNRFTGSGSTTVSGSPATFSVGGIILGDRITFGSTDIGADFTASITSSSHMEGDYGGVDSGTFVLNR
jgi:hypothetical protein